MNDVLLDKIKTIRYENRIVIVIDAALAKLAGTDKIEFQSAIQNGNYVLIGPKVKEIQDQSNESQQSNKMEVANVIKAV